MVSWHKNERKLDQAEEISGIDFAPNMRVLTITNVTYDDSGSYQCRASNDVGVIRSSKLLNITIRGKGEKLKLCFQIMRDFEQAKVVGLDLQRMCLLRLCLLLRERGWT